ncbi:MAG: DMT family transporter [Chloroflexia bacterium]
MRPHHPLDPVGLLWALAAATLGGTVGIAAKGLLLYQAGPLPISALRTAVAAFALALALLLFRRSALRLEGKDLPFFVLYGLVGVAAMYLLYILAVMEIGATLATALFYVYPTIATLLAALFLKERLTWRKALPLPVTFLGCLLAVGIGSGERLAWHPAGLAAGFLAATAFALYPLLARRAMARYSPWTTLFYSLLFGALWLNLLWGTLCPFLPADGRFCGTPPPPSGDRLFWLVLLYLALFATVGLYLADLQAIRRLEVRQVGLIGTLEPLITGLLAYLLFRERFTPLQWLGAALILSGVAWLRWEKM